MKVRTYKFDDKEYLLINQVNYNNLKYVFLATEDEKETLVQKIYNNKPNEICSLDSDEEFDFAMRLFAEKLNAIGNNEENNG